MMMINIDTEILNVEEDLNKNLIQFMKIQNFLFLIFYLYLPIGLKDSE